MLIFPPVVAGTPGWVFAGMGALMIGGGVVLAGLGIFLGRARWIYQLSVITLAASLVALFFDDLGWADLLAGSPAALALALLALRRRSFLPSIPGSHPQ